MFWLVSRRKMFDNQRKRERSISYLSNNIFYPIFQMNITKIWFAKKDKIEMYQKNMIDIILNFSVFKFRRSDLMNLAEPF
jgi:hypothetical protein